MAAMYWNPQHDRLPIQMVAQEGTAGDPPGASSGPHTLGPWRRCHRPRSCRGVPRGRRRWQGRGDVSFRMHGPGPAPLWRVARGERPPGRRCGRTDAGYAGLGSNRLTRAVLGEQVIPTVDRSIPQTGIASYWRPWSDRIQGQARQPLRQRQGGALHKDIEDGSRLPDGVWNVRGCHRGPAQVHRSGL